MFYAVEHEYNEKNSRTLSRSSYCFHDAPSSNTPVTRSGVQIFFHAVKHEIYLPNIRSLPIILIIIVHVKGLTYANSI